MSFFRSLSAGVLGSALFVGVALAETNTYQVTGPIVDVTPTSIIVQKDKEKWEIAKDQATPVKGGALTKGAKVTIKYRMTATNIEVKK